MVCRWGPQTAHLLCKMPRARLEIHATFVLSGGYERVGAGLPEDDFTIHDGD
jgi:hypothetical protein